MSYFSSDEPALDPIRNPTPPSRVVFGLAAGVLLVLSAVGAISFSLGSVFSGMAPPEALQEARRSGAAWAVVAYGAPLGLFALAVVWRRSSARMGGINAGHGVRVIAAAALLPAIASCFVWLLVAAGVPGLASDGVQAIVVVGRVAVVASGLGVAAAVIAVAAGRIPHDREPTVDAGIAVAYAIVPVAMIVLLFL